MSCCLPSLEKKALAISVKKRQSLLRVGKKDWELSGQTLSSGCKPL
jgi:hypothetical protein